MRKSAGLKTWPLNQSRLLDELDMYCAGVHSFTKDREHFFRLFCRKGMFELYVDELLVQSYVIG